MRYRLFVAIVVAAASLGSCDGPTAPEAASSGPQVEPLYAYSGPGFGVVSDLSATDVGVNTARLTWTQVDDGTGSAAWYRVKYAEPNIAWKTATIGSWSCNVVRGRDIGSVTSCTADGLTAATTYDFQLMSYRLENGVWVNARYSNVATATTEPGALSVTDLGFLARGWQDIWVKWTQIDDGTGAPARYRVKYAEGTTIDYGSATRACDVQGQDIGKQAFCIIDGLQASTTYTIQLMSYRLENGLWVNAVRSNTFTQTTSVR